MYDQHTCMMSKVDMMCSKLSKQLHQNWQVLVLVADGLSVLFFPLIAHFILSIRGVVAVTFVFFSAFLRAFASMSLFLHRVWLQRSLEMDRWKIFRQKRQRLGIVSSKPDRPSLPRSHWRARTDESIFGFWLWFRRKSNLWKTWQFWLRQWSLHKVFIQS